MNPFEHWLPVSASRDLERGQVKELRVAGETIALFRTETGALGALPDRCPHRGAKLSCGKVKGERLECGYHAWTYGADGQGRSPGSPDLPVSTEAFRVAEHLGAIWIRRGADALDLPKLPSETYTPAYVLHHVAPSPVEYLLDNFIELEHAGIGHWMFGYGTESMAEVTCESEVRGDHVHVDYHGPVRRMPWWFRLGMGLGARDTLTMHFDIYPDPIRVFYHYYATSPSGTRRPLFDIKEDVYFTRVDEGRCRLVAFYASGIRLIPPIRQVVQAVMAEWIEYEYAYDQRLLESLAVSDGSLTGMRLSRFDKPLVEIRRLLKSGGSAS